jgi:L-amino acid N-acyltransferase YncA
MQRILATAKGLNHHSVLARMVNEVSIKLLKLFHFQTVGVMKEVGFKCGKWLDVTIMQLMLSKEYLFVQSSL